MDRLSGDKPTEASVVGMAFQVVASADGLGRRFAYVSPSCQALHGVSAEAAMADANALYDLIVPEHRERVAAAERNAILAQSSFTIDAPFRRLDGGERWFRIISTPHVTPEGVTAWDGIQVDITEERSQQRRLELALDATGLGLWEYKIASGELFWSARARELFGADPDQPVDFETFTASVHPEDLAGVLAGYQAALGPEGGDFSFEHRIPLADGGVRWVLSHGRVIAEGGEPQLVIGTTLDITARKHAEEVRALLLGELNHRVKNDFQIVHGLLDLQSHRVDDPAIRLELEKAQRRVAGIARAHQNLYAEDGRPVVEMDLYLGEICRDLAEGMFEDVPASLEWRIEPHRLSRERAVAVGLIVNELVTNAVKHAFAGERQGRVEVVFARDGEGLRLIVADDGPGLPDDYGDSKGLGRNLVQAFAQQAGGVFERLDGPGARFQLRMDL